MQKETNREIKVIVENQKSCDAKETVTIMNKFVSVDKVDVIIGGTCSSTAETPENQEVIDVAGDAANGLIYIMPGNPPATPAYQALSQRYQEKYNETVPPYFMETYDAVMLGVKAVLASDGTKENTKDKLYEVSRTYQGVSGNVEFDVDGDVIKPILIKQIKNGQFVEYEE